MLLCFSDGIGSVTWGTREWDTDFNTHQERRKKIEIQCVYMYCNNEKCVNIFVGWVLGFGWNTGKWERLSLGAELDAKLDAFPW